LRINVSGGARSAMGPTMAFEVAGTSVLMGGRSGQHAAVRRSGSL
jgi:hypothetical protein